MSRPLRIQYPGAWYHVMNRGRRGEKIFYHLLVKTPDANLSRSMRHLNSLYTQRFNRRHGYDGPLFRGRYKSILVESDSCALELVKYIHRNPY